MQTCAIHSPCKTPVLTVLCFRLAAAEYAKILAQRQKEAKEAKELKRRRLAGQISSSSCRIILRCDLTYNFVQALQYILVTGLLPFASPSAPCPASRRLILALHAEEINSRKPQSPSLTIVIKFLPMNGMEDPSLIQSWYQLFATSEMANFTKKRPRIQTILP